MRETEHFGLKLPDVDDFYNVEDQNENMEKIDERLAAKADLDSPALTGKPTAPTPSGTDGSARIATTAFVQAVAAEVIRTIAAGALSLGETASTAYRGDRGKTAYEHSQSAHLALGETTGTAYAGNKGKALADAMGALSGLATTAKTTLVAAINELNAKKVNAVSGKQLSTNDYTAAEKNKLAGIAAGANVTPSGLMNGYVRTGQKAGTTIGNGATAEGYNTTASSYGAHAEGDETIASGYYSHAEGQGTIASSYGQCAIGIYNVQYGTDADSVDSLFIIGNGNYKTRNNVFRVDSWGSVYGKRAYNSSGADYAEFFEWLDGNPEAEDRRGYFATLDGKKIKLASPGDYILGIVSAAPVVIGNSDPDNWHGRFLRDDFGNYIMQTITEQIPTGEDTYEEVERESCVLNPAFDESKDKDYIPRSDRPEWSPIGMLGQLIVRDDGSCQINRYCKVAAGGIATASDTGWRVIERVTEGLIKIVFR